MAGELLICRENEKYGIVLSGRVNFETVVPLREFVNHLPGDIRDLTIDLKECLSMDSTCMGVLSMLALNGIKSKLSMRVLNAGSNRQLLKGLGVDKLFKFEDAEFTPYSVVIFPAAAPEKKDLQQTAETVLVAHETLIAADESNQQRFGAVVVMSRQDVERMRENKK